MELLYFSLQLTLTFWSVWIGLCTVMQFLPPSLSFALYRLRMNVSQSHSKGHTKYFSFPPAYNIPPRGESKFMLNLYTFMHSSPLTFYSTG